MFNKFAKYITWASEITVVVFMVLITLDVLLGVFFRYILGNALSWSEELARYMMIWMCFIAASLVIREEKHLGIKLLQDTLKPFPRKIIQLSCDVVIITFLGVLLVTSWQVLQIIKYDISSGLNIRLLWPFLAIPVCAILMIIQQLILIPIHLKSDEQTRAEEYD